MLRTSQAIQHFLVTACSACQSHKSTSLKLYFYHLSIVYLGTWKSHKIPYMNATLNEAFMGAKDQFILYLPCTLWLPSDHHCVYSGKEPYTIQYRFECMQVPM